MAPDFFLNTIGQWVVYEWTRAYVQVQGGGVFLPDGLMRDHF